MAVLVERSLAVERAIDRLRQTLNSHGLLVSRARVILFELLLNHEPQTIAELAKRSRGEIDRATIYRNVALFEQLGIVQRLYIGWKYKLELTDKFAEHHHHLACSNCGKLIPITEEAALANFIKQISTAHHFRAQTHQLEVQGLCQTCQASDKMV
jgi:Fe2+ or Zn2+ uptake regulation protein